MLKDKADETVDHNINLINLIKSAWNTWNNRSLLKKDNRYLLDFAVVLFLISVCVSFLFLIIGILC